MARPSGTAGASASRCSTAAWSGLRRRIHASTAAMSAEAENPVTLNNFAMLLLIPESAVHDVTHALRLAQRAADRTGHGEAAILDTLARAHAANGNMDEAARTAGTALALVGGKSAGWISKLEADAATWRQAVASR